MLKTVPATMPCTNMPPVWMPTAVLISRDGELPPSLNPFAPRLVSNALTVVLVDHLRQPSLAPAPDADNTPPVTGELTPREC